MSLVVLARRRGEADPCSLSPLRLRERAEWLSKEKRELPGEEKWRIEDGSLKPAGLLQLGQVACTTDWGGI